MRNLLKIAMLFSLSGASWAQVDAQKLDAVCHAIAHAEGFYRKGTIPSRYHNPGDLKSRPGIMPLPGQVRIGKAGHIVFRDDQAGWSALQEYLTKLVDGRSRRYVASMSYAQLSRVYAQHWQPWLRIVTAELRIDATTRLDVYLKPDSGVDFLDGFCYVM